MDERRWPRSGRSPARRGTRWILPVLAAASLGAGGCATIQDWFAGRSDYPKSHIAWGHLQERDGHYKEARRSYAFVLERDPDNIEALLGLARLDGHAGLNDAAWEKLEKALQLAPQSPAVHAARSAHFARLQQWDEAEHAMQKAVALAPNDKEYTQQLAVVLARRGRTDEALQFFRRSTGGEAEAHFNLACILYDMNDDSGCERQLELALARNPRLTAARQLKQLLAEQRGEVATAGGEPPDHPRLIERTSASRAD